MMIPLRHLCGNVVVERKQYYSVRVGQKKVTDDVSNKRYNDITTCGRPTLVVPFEGFDRFVWISKTNLVPIRLTTTTTTTFLNCFLRNGST